MSLAAPAAVFTPIRVRPPLAARSSGVGRSGRTAWNRRRRSRGRACCSTSGCPGCAAAGATCAGRTSWPSWLGIIFVFWWRLLRTDRGILGRDLWISRLGGPQSRDFGFVSVFTRSIALDQSRDRSRDQQERGCWMTSPHQLLFYMGVFAS